MFWIFLQILGALGVFLYGLQVMSEGLQKAAGTKLRALLSGATRNRFTGTVSGFLVTCAVQSSSATTVMIVAFCSAGLLTLTQSLGVIFGANIGTTTTAWLVAVGFGVKVSIIQYAVPLIGIGFFSQFIRRWSLPHKVGQSLVGFGLLFLGLGLLKDAVPDIGDNPAIEDFLLYLQPGTTSGLALAVAFGTVITAIVQSSSASMAITLTAAFAGYIDFPTACAMALGQNIGTTITAALATIGAPLVARRAALAHILFNLLGAIWPIFMLGPFLSVIDSIVPGDPYGTSEAAHKAITTHIAMFHTMFNMANAVIFLMALKPVERLIVRLLPDGKGEDDEHALMYLETAFGSTPEIAIEAAAREVDRMAGVAEDMLVDIRAALDPKHPIDQRLYDKILKAEKLTDILEHRITEYLAALVHGPLSTASSHEALSLLRMINELERVGDHGEKIARLLKRLHDGESNFSSQAYADLTHMADATEISITGMRKLILDRDPEAREPGLERERALDALRDDCRNRHLDRLMKNDCDAMAGLIYSDILSSLEKMGDHAFNVVEATLGQK
jgi:phosphate:Na+ symporter